jgi:peptide deformylase
MELLKLSSAASLPRTKMDPISVSIQESLVPHTDPILRTPLEAFDFSDPQTDPQSLAEDLVRMMREGNGIGLAANQVGLNLRVFALEGDPAYVCFNPRIVMPGSEQIVLEEGCLSYPGLLVKVKRPRDIKVRFIAPDGETYTKTFTGMTARAFQHELDHLDGITMLDRSNRFHRDSALNKWKKWKRKNEHLLSV